MARRGEVLALVQAGGQGGRMDVLTRERAKPALPYGGVHRLIDFALSSLVHADLADVWVSLEYQVTSIDDYLSGGRPWSLDRNRGGFRRMVPQTGTGPATESGFATATATCCCGCRPTSRPSAPRRCVVCSADHVFNMDLGARSSTSTSPPAGWPRCSPAEVTKKDAADNVVVAERRRTARSPASSTSRRARRAGTVATEVFIYDTAVAADRRCASCGPSCRATRRATTAVSATSASTCCRASSSPARRSPCR